MQRTLRHVASLSLPACLFGIVGFSTQDVHAETLLAGVSLPRTASTESRIIAPDLWARHTLLGDWYGLRPALDNVGISFSLNQTSDYLGNTQGGLRQGFVYDGLLDLEIDVDLNKAVGWRGGLFHATGYGIQGQDLSTQFVGNLMTASNIEATPSIGKLGEVWLGQQLLDNRLNLRAGLIEADHYYMISPTASVFVNSTFGFPDAWEANMPGAGPGFPNAVPGGLVSYNLDTRLKITASVMNGSPVGPTTSSTSYGTGFPVGDGVLSWFELAYSTRFHQGEATLSGTYKIGGWYNSNKVDNVTLSQTGRTFTNPVNQNYRGQYSVYGLLDQTLWREPNSLTQGLSAFVRATLSPQQQMSVVTSYFDTGVAYTGLFDHRPEDILALGFAWAKFTPYLNSQIAAENTLSGTATPMPTPEQLIELTYQAPISPWLTLQPFAQYVINPGGKAPMTNNPNQAIPNATIVGVRANIAF